MLGSNFGAMYLCSISVLSYANRPMRGIPDFLSCLAGVEALSLEGVKELESELLALVAGLVLLYARFKSVTPLVREEEVLILPFEGCRLQESCRWRMSRQKNPENTW